LIVIWQPEATADVARIVRDRSNYSPESAERLAKAIIARVDQIAEFPQSGRMIPEFQLPRLREVLEQDYRILYEVYADRIEVFGVISSRQLLTGRE
jgi:plasmid stabilization system protein ParE